MPLLRVTTNAPINENQQTNVLLQLSQCVAESLGKSEDYVMVILETEGTMAFAGNTTPTAYLELKSLGLPEDNTQQLSQALCEAVTKTLAISADRIYIEFANPPRHFWGWNSRTF